VSKVPIALRTCEILKLIRFSLEPACMEVTIATSDCPGANLKTLPEPGRWAAKKKHENVITSNSKNLSENVEAGFQPASEGGILPPVPGQTRGWKPLHWQPRWLPLRQKRNFQTSSQPVLDNDPSRNARGGMGCAAVGGQHQFRQLWRGAERWHWRC
jgi:hypothetical protein